MSTQTTDLLAQMVRAQEAQMRRISEIEDLVNRRLKEFADALVPTIAKALQGLPQKAGPGITSAELDVLVTSVHAVIQRRLAPILARLSTVEQRLPAGGGR